jgi:hypothetical protein
MCPILGLHNITAMVVQTAEIMAVQRVPEVGIEIVELRTSIEVIGLNIIEIVVPIPEDLDQAVLKVPRVDTQPEESLRTNPHGDSLHPMDPSLREKTSLDVIFAQCLLKSRKIVRHKVL